MRRTRGLPSCGLHAGEPHGCARVAYMHHTVWITCTLYIYSCVVNFLPRILDILRVKRHTGGVGFRSFQEIKKKKRWKSACVGKRLNNFYITYLFIEKKDNIFLDRVIIIFFYKKLMASSAKAWIPVNII